MNAKFENETADSPQDVGEEAFEAAEPFQLFDKWMEYAVAKETADPNAMALATADGDGQPNVRMVLLKGFGVEGFSFYTNLESDKALELAANPRAALCFHWKSVRRQVRILGPVVPVSDEEADAYFATRAKDSQIGAWASKQSRPLQGRFELEKSVAKYIAKYAIKKIERPGFWSGYRVVPLRFEFWRNRASRLHDRKVYKRNDVNSTEWIEERLYP